VIVPRATGTFEVTLTPQATDDDGSGNPLGRFALAKVFSGDLTGTSTGEMLGAGSPAKGAAGYVAMERVRGALAGREGSFVLQHTGTMHHGTNSLSIHVVPETGTGELSGISGQFVIIIEGKKHSYEFDYDIAAG
jgi:Protein of unknown function (DUF3224)